MIGDEEKDLGELADETEQKAPPLAGADALKIKRVLTDGLCKIVSITRGTPPALAVVHTDFGESFPIFTYEVDKACRRVIQRRVKLHVAMSNKGTRFVSGVDRAPETARHLFWPCLNCEGYMKRSEDKTRYSCPQCSYQVEL